MSTLAADAFREQSTPGASEMLGVWPATVRVPWPSESYDGCACGRHCRPNLVFDTTGNSKDPGLSPDRERCIQQCGTHDCDQLAADFQWTADDVLDTADCGYADGAGMHNRFMMSSTCSGRGTLHSTAHRRSPSGQSWGVAFGLPQDWLSAFHSVGFQTHEEQLDQKRENQIYCRDGFILFGAMIHLFFAISDLIVVVYLFWPKPGAESGPPESCHR